jgi:tetratricopeptide (TPR) repeat protein
VGRRNFDSALEQYDAVLEFDPHNRLALNMKGYCHAYQGDFDKALQILNLYSQRSPEEPNPYDSLGEVYRYMGITRKSASNYRRSIRNNENMLASYLGLGNTYMDAGKFRKAHRAYRLYLERATDRATLRGAYRSLAYSSWRLGKSEASIDYFQRSMDFDDDLFFSLQILDAITSSLGLTDRMETYVTRTYQDINTQLHYNPEAPRQLGEMSLRYGLNIEETRSVLQEIEKTTQSSIARMWSQIYLGLLDINTGDDDSYLASKDGFLSGYKAFIKTTGSMVSYYTWSVLMQFNLWASSHPSEGLDLYDELIDYADSEGVPAAVHYLRLLRTDLYSRLKTDNGVKELKSLGFVPEDLWSFIGPFDFRNGFNRRFPPERFRRSDRTYRGKDGRVTWKTATDDFHDGYINLKQNFSDNNWSVAYACIHIDAPDSMDVQFRIGSNESIKIWLNEEEVFMFNDLRISFLDHNIIPVQFKPGINRVLLKICNRIGEWGFFFRVTDEDGRGIPDIVFHSPVETIASP